MNQYKKRVYQKNYFRPEEIQLMDRKYFVKTFGLIKDFRPWMIEEMKKHISAGGSYKSFTGRFHICGKSWWEITRNSQELTEIRQEYNERIVEKKRFGI